MRGSARLVLCFNPSPVHRSIICRKTISSQGNAKQKLIEELRKVDTAAICDADKILLSQAGGGYEGIRVLKGIRCINAQSTKHVMVGEAKTIQTEHNDFLAVLRGLMEAKEGEILMVDSRNSDRAVAGELFCLQAVQKRLEGIIVDGPVRDTTYVKNLPQIRCYSKTVSPNSGYTQSPGSVDVSIICCGARVCPKDIVVGDDDGVIVADENVFSQLVPLAREIHDSEAKVKDDLLNGGSLAELTNYEEHIAARLKGEKSSLGFRV